MVCDEKLDAQVDFRLTCDARNIYVRRWFDWMHTGHYGKPAKMYPVSLVTTDGTPQCFSILRLKEPVQCTSWKRPKG